MSSLFNKPSQVKSCTCLRWTNSPSAGQLRRGRPLPNGPLRRCIWKRRYHMWANVCLGKEVLRMSHAALVHVLSARFGILGAEWRRSSLSSDDECIGWKYFKGDVSKRKEEWCFSISAQRCGSIKVTLYSFCRAWTNSRCSRPINLQMHERNHMSHAAFLIIPHVIYFLTRTRILPRISGNTRIMATWLLLISLEKVSLPPPPPPPHLFRGQAWF